MQGLNDCKDTKFLGICIALFKKRTKIAFHKFTVILR